MADRFRWQFEEDQKSENHADPTPRSRPKRSPWSRALTWAGLAIILMLFGNAARNKVEERSLEGVLQTETELLQTHSLMLQSGWQKDTELYGEFLSATHLQWHSDQRGLIRRDLLWDRAPLRLWLDYTTALTSLQSGQLGIELSMAPDLKSAIVLTALPYLTGGNALGYKRIELLQTNHYMLEKGNWKLQPNPRQVLGGKSIVLNNPFPITTSVSDPLDKEDERLASDLLIDLQLLCERSRCAPLSTFELKFSNDPRSFVSFEETIHVDARSYRPRNGPVVILPGPDIVGRPADEAAYQALLNGYASWLGTFVLIHSIPGVENNWESLTASLDMNDLLLPSVSGFHPQASAAAAPIPYPEQQVLLSCPNTHAMQQGIIFDPETNKWQPFENITFVNQQARGQLQDLESVQCSIPLCRHFIGEAQAMSSPERSWYLSQSERNTSWRLLDDSGAVIQRFDETLHSPAWINERSLLFLQKQRAEQEDQAQSDAKTDDSQLLLFEMDDSGAFRNSMIVDGQALINVMPVAERPRQANVEQYALGVADKETLFLFAATGAQHEALQFELDLTNGRLRFLTRWIDNGYLEMPLEVAPDGRSLAMTRYSRSRSYVTILSLASGQRKTFSLSGRPGARYAWSENGDWLVISDEQLLWLVTPGQDYQRPIEHNFAGCTAVSWK